jgi:hypothetical protein
MIRKPLGRLHKRKLLEQQNHQCYYCGADLNEFGIKTHFDHVVSFNYSGNNHPSNFVAACEMCNLLKSDLFFDSLEEAKEYVVNERLRRQLPVRNCGIIEIPQFRCKGCNKIIERHGPDHTFCTRRCQYHYRALCRRRASQEWLKHIVQDVPVSGSL